MTAAGRYGKQSHFCCALLLAAWY
eukprot:COSAG02_NODE_63747_length_262_cov_0.938650_2_plen_23_part_01